MSSPLESVSGTDARTAGLHVFGFAVNTTLPLEKS